MSGDGEASKSWFASRLAALGGASFLAKAAPALALAGAAFVVIEGVIVLRRMRRRRDAEEAARLEAARASRRPTRIFEEEEGDAMR